ncbi:conserved protein, unknown function, partial [Hepatocystis sp. ex Piliocolobus tephrosceles]
VNESFMHLDGNLNVDVVHDKAGSCTTTNNINSNVHTNSINDIRSINNSHQTTTKPNKTKKDMLSTNMIKFNIFDNSYIQLIKKESTEFTHILIYLNLINKIDTYIKDDTSNNTVSFFVFFHNINKLSLTYIDELASSIITFFRSLFQNPQSPLFKIDKPEWGLKYLFYQSVISNYIIKMCLTFDQTIEVNNTKFLQHILQYFFGDSEKEKNIMENINQYDYNKKNIQQEKVDTREGKLSTSVEHATMSNISVEHATMSSISVERSSVDNNNVELPIHSTKCISNNKSDDVKQNNNFIKPFDNTYKNMDYKMKQTIFNKMTNYEIIINKLNYKIITECRLYILSRISYIIHLYYLEEITNKTEIKKSFLNFMHHIIFIYKKLIIQDPISSKHLLSDFVNNTFIQLLNIKNINDVTAGGTCNIVGTTIASTDMGQNYKKNNFLSNNNLNNEQSIQQLLITKMENTNEIKGVNIRDFFLLIEKEHIVDMLKDMSNKNCCVHLKNNIILEENDCINEYSLICIELLKNISNRITHFDHSNEFVEDYISQVVNKILIIMKDEFRNKWNIIDDLIGDCNTTCLLYLSFCTLNRFLKEFKYKTHIKEMISSYKALKKKMFYNFLDAFYHFITIRIYNLFTVHYIYHEYIFNNLNKIKRALPYNLFMIICKKILHKLDHTILDYILNQSTTFFHNEYTFNVFITNSNLILQHVEYICGDNNSNVGDDCKDNNDMYSNSSSSTTTTTNSSSSCSCCSSDGDNCADANACTMPLLEEIINLMTDNIDNLKKKITKIKNSYTQLLKNKNNWMDNVTKITNVLLKGYSIDDHISSSESLVQYKGEMVKNKKKKKIYKISLKKMKFLLLRRPDINLMTNDSVVIQEFIEN